MIDLILILLLLLAGLNGARRGIITAGLSAIGWLVGVLIGIQLVPWALDALRILPGNDGARLVVHIVGVLLCAGIASGFMQWIAASIVRALDWTPVRFVDGLLGAVASVAVMAVVLWLLAAVVRPAASPTWSRALAQSQMLTTIDELMPLRASGLLDDMRASIDSSRFPQVFDTLRPEPITDVAAADTTSAQTEAVAGVADSVIKVRALSTQCDSIGQGSGWVVAPDRVVTNAHVVAGANQVSVQVTGRGEHRRGTVVAFDPDLDLAIISVPGLNAEPLARKYPVQSGASVVIAGFPRDGSYTVTAARVRGELNARGQDIYGRSGVTREIYALAAAVEPGNSGGPLLSPSGEVVGTIFARSLDDPGTGYALTDEASDSLVGQAADLTQTVDTRGCLAD